MVDTLDTLDAGGLRRWAVSALSGLGHAREEIDALNVYPVPDGDTGTNLYLTVESACAAVLALPQEADLESVAATLRPRGPAGRSGQLRGHPGAAPAWPRPTSLAERGGLDAAAMAHGLRRADEQAWAAVGHPVEGTILSVSRAAADAAGAATSARATTPDARRCRDECRGRRCGRPRVAGPPGRRDRRTVGGTPS